jgi:hypothetical protein
MNEQIRELLDWLGKHAGLVGHRRTVNGYELHTKYGSYAGPNIQELCEDAIHDARLAMANKAKE